MAILRQVNTMIHEIASENGKLWLADPRRGRAAHAKVFGLGTKAL
jgi:hypothetical protein